MIRCHRGSLGCFISKGWTTFEGRGPQGVSVDGGAAGPQGRTLLKVGSGFRQKTSLSGFGSVLPAENAARYSQTKT